jgi:hypothetical protein
MVDILKPVSIIMEDGQRFTGLFSLTQDENAVLIGEGAPSIAPNYTGQGYLARSTKQFYTSNNIGQWVPLSIGSSASGVFSLMSDVEFTNLQNNQEIKYVASTGKWINFTPTSGGGGGGGGASLLSELGDVITTSPEEGNVLFHDGLEWINKDLVLNDLFKVSVESESNNEVLAYDSGEWINKELTIDMNSDVELSNSIAPGSALIYDDDYQQWVNTRLELSLMKDIEFGTSSLAPNVGDQLIYIGGPDKRWRNAKGLYRDFIHSRSLLGMAVTNISFQVVPLNVSSIYINKERVRVTVRGSVGRSSAGYVYLSLAGAAINLSSSDDVTPVGTEGLAVVYVASNMDLVSFSFEYTQDTAYGDIYDQYRVTMHSDSAVDVAYLGRRGIDDSILVPTTISLDVYTNDYLAPSS